MVRSLVRRSASQTTLPLCLLPCLPPLHCLPLFKSQLSTFMTTTSPGTPRLTPAQTAPAPPAASAPPSQSSSANSTPTSRLPLRSLHPATIIPSRRSSSTSSIRKPLTRTSGLLRMVVALLAPGVLGIRDLVFCGLLFLGVFWDSFQSAFLRVVMAVSFLKF